MENHIIFPIKSYIIRLTRLYVGTIWMIANKNETNWTRTIIQYMLGCMWKGICLPYTSLVTNVLEHVGYNFEEEEYTEYVTKIGEATLGSTRY